MFKIVRILALSEDSPNAAKFGSYLLQHFHALGYWDFQDIKL
jgi:hypothetical protein